MRNHDTDSGRCAFWGYERWEGVPLLDGALIHLELALEDSTAGGDHRIFIARVIHIRMFEGTPLIHWRGADAGMGAA
jgi:flavin reductase (DIM6/NTAB) family NADH-FMN oxidoreductase RutF